MTVDHLDISAPLSNFPILIYLSASSGRNGDDVTCVFNEVGANKFKIAVTTSDGQAQCYVEIEKWDNANKKASLWVKVPNITSDADTDLYLYYDNTHADNTTYVGDTNSIPAENVWDANFKMVQHLADGATSAATYDSTSNNKDGSKEAAGHPAQTTSGKIANAQDFDGADDFVDCSIDFGSVYTISAWVKVKTGATQTSVIGGDSTAKYAGNFIWAASNRYLAGCKHADGSYLSTGNGTVYEDAWHHVTYVVNNTYHEIYLDGASKASQTETYSPQTCQLHRIGTRGSGEVWAYAIIDEVRISNCVRSSGWIKASYESERDHLLDFWPEETAGPVGGHTKTRIVDKDGGSGVYTSIQSAIDSLGTDGGVVYVEGKDGEGQEYTIASPITVPSNVALIGRGNVVIKIDASSDICAIRNSDYSNGNERITVLGFHIKSRNTGQLNYELVDFRKVKHCLLQDLTIDGIQRNRAGISLGTALSEGNRITNCTVSRCGHGIVLVPAGAGDGPERNSITGCTIYDCHVGIYMWRGHRNVVRGNVCRDTVPTGSDTTGHDGILAEEGADNVFQGNVCYHNCEHGIYISGTATGGSGGNTITGNDCYDNAGCGIHLCGQLNCDVHVNAIVGNICCNNDVDGIALDSYAKKNSVTGNICAYNSSYGIRELGTGSEENIILGNICVNNALECDIKPRSGSNTIVEHNKGRPPPP